MHRFSRRSLIHRRTFAALLLAVAWPGLDQANAGETKPGSTIVFVCEHGSVKSLMAMQWFNKLATERGLLNRAISRGITPDQAVPQGIADNLAKDGLPVRGFTPTRLAKSDLSDALRVISIGVDVTSVTQGSAVRVDGWNDIPSASENYAASRDALRVRIESLLTEIGGVESKSRLRGPRRPIR